MFGFIHAIESSLFNVGLNCAFGSQSGPQQTRIIRQTSRRSAAKLVDALHRARFERDEALCRADALAVENVRLRAALARRR